MGSFVKINIIELDKKFKFSCAKPTCNCHFNSYQMNHKKKLKTALTVRQDTTLYDQHTNSQIIIIY